MKRPEMGTIRFGSRLRNVCNSIDVHVSLSFGHIRGGIKKF